MKILFYHKLIYLPTQIKCNVTLFAVCSSSINRISEFFKSVAEAKVFHRSFKLLVCLHLSEMPQEQPADIKV